MWRARRRSLPGWKAIARWVSRAPIKASDPLLIRFWMRPNCQLGSRSFGGQADTSTDARKIPKSASERASKTAARSGSMLLAAGRGRWPRTGSLRGSMSCGESQQNLSKLALLRNAWPHLVPRTPRPGRRWGGEGHPKNLSPNQGKRFWPRAMVERPRNQLSKQAHKG